MLNHRSREYGIFTMWSKCKVQRKYIHPEEGHSHGEVVAAHVCGHDVVLLGLQLRLPLLHASLFVRACGRKKGEGLGNLLLTNT